MGGKKIDYISVSGINMKCILNVMSIKIMSLNTKHNRESFLHYT